jgi:hypothetical protein
MKTAEEKLKEAIDLIDECKLQIEYLHGKFKKTGTSESVLARIYAFDGSYAKPDTPDIDNDSLTKDFREWLGWNDQLAPDPDDEDYYTYSWGLNVWCNAYKAYKQALSLPTLNRDKVMEMIADILSGGNWKTIHVGHSAKILDVQFITKTKVIKLADTICSLSLPTLSEGEIDELTKEFLEKFTTWRWDMYEDAAMMNERVRPIDIVEWFKAALKELTKPKEER